MSIPDRPSLGKALNAEGWVDDQMISIDTLARADIVLRTPFC